MTMSSSPDRYRVTGVLRAADAATIPAVRFDVDFRGDFRGAVLPAEQLAEARTAAVAQGYAAGWAEGKRKAADATRTAAEQVAAAHAQAVAEQAAALDRAVGAIAAAAAALERQAGPAAAEAEDAILRTAVALTETLIGHELAVSQRPGEDALRRALALAPAHRPVTVRLHPADHAALVGDHATGRELAGRTVTMLPDPALRPGDAVAECDASTIDARIGAALDRVREVLGS
jgi:flagellar assembly protein FliH